MNKQTMERICTKKPGWPTLSPLNWMSAGIRWMCALKAKGVFASIEASWLSLLMEPGDLVGNKEDKSLLVVIKVGVYGFCGVTVWLKKVSDGGRDRGFQQRSSLPSQSCDR